MDTRQTFTNGAMKVSPGISTDSMAALGFYAQVQPYGALKISLEPSSVFVDPFDGASVDTTNRWTLSGTVPSQTAGNFTLNGGTTASATSVAISKPTFQPPGLGFRICAAAITLAAAKVPNQNTHYWWGAGQVTAYAIGTPVTDGFGFEVDITGELCAVAWVAGVRYVINSTNPALITAAGSLPTGAAAAAFSAMSWPTPGPHIYAVIDRGDTAFFYIDSTDVPIGYCRNIQPQAQTLPFRIAKINAGASVVASSFSCSGVVMGDSTSQNCTISDPSFPWRRAGVSQSGALQTESKNSYNHIATAATTVVATGAGNLHSITINSKGTVASTVTVYDNTAASGAVIAILDSLNQSGTHTFDVAFSTGLTIVTTGTVAPDITVSYR